MGELAGRTAWVTGGASGIGRAAVDRLIAAGATVGVLDIDLTGCADVAGTRCDVASASDVDAAAAALTSEIGQADILVNAAGIPVAGTVDGHPEESWRRALDVNLSGPFLVARAVFGGMRSRRWGRIVSLTSGSAVRVGEGLAAYAASKAGLIALTKVLALEGAPFGITANAVAPGVTDTPMSRAALGGERGLREAVTTGRLANPMGVVLEPIDMAEAIAFLAGDRARYITGQVLHVNGGSVMP